jgi:hypothetical protein
MMFLRFGFQQCTAFAMLSGFYKKCSQVTHTTEFEPFDRNFEMKSPTRKGGRRRGKKNVRMLRYDINHLNKSFYTNLMNEGLHKSRTLAMYCRTRWSPTSSLFKIANKKAQLTCECRTTYTAVISRLPHSPFTRAHSRSFLSFLRVIE